VTVTIGNTPATVLFAGLVGPGLYQINVVVPPTLADGDHAVVASVAGVNSQSGALLKVAASAKLDALTAMIQQVMGTNNRAPALRESVGIEGVAQIAGLLTPRTHMTANACEGEQEGCLIQL